MYLCDHCHLDVLSILKRLSVLRVIIHPRHKKIKVLLHLTME